MLVKETKFSPYIQIWTKFVIYVITLNKISY